MGRHLTVLQLLGKLKTAHSSHHHIEEQEIVRRNVFLQSLFCRIGGLYLITISLKIELQDFTEILLVVDY